MTGKGGNLRPLCWLTHIIRFVKVLTGCAQGACSVLFMFFFHKYPPSLPCFGSYLCMLLSVTTWLFCISGQILLRRHCLHAHTDCLMRSWVLSHQMVCPSVCGITSSDKWFLLSNCCPCDTTYICYSKTLPSRWAEGHIIQQQAGISMFGSAHMLHQCSVVCNQEKKTTTMACVLLQSWGHVICYSPQDSYLQRAGPTQCNFPCFAEVTNTCNISVKLLDDFFPKMIMLEPPSGVLLSKNEWRLLNPGSSQSCYWMLNQLSFSFTVGALIHSCHQINIL